FASATGQEPSATYTYAGMGFANPHAVTSIGNGTATTTYSYDNNGNLTCGWRIRKTPRLGSAQRPGAARAAPAGLPKSVRLCEDLRIRHAQDGDGSKDARATS